jgi:hypothetical protein
MCTRVCIWNRKRSKDKSVVFVFIQNSGYLEIPHFAYYLYFWNLRWLLRFYGGHGRVLKTVCLALMSHLSEGSWPFLKPTVTLIFLSPVFGTFPWKYIHFKVPLIQNIYFHQKSIHPTVFIQYLFVLRVKEDIVRHIKFGTVTL